MINMKKMSKKVVGTVLAAAMTMSMAVSAFAATPDTITVNFIDNVTSQEFDSEIVSTQPLLTSGTHFQGKVLNAILEASDISKNNKGEYEFSMLYGTQATLLDVINQAAVQGEADPVYGATNAYDPNGIFVDSLHDMATENTYGDYDSEGKPHSWKGKSWSIEYKQGNGTPYAADYYANNEKLEDTPVTDITLTYNASSMEW